MQCGVASLKPTSSRILKIFSFTGLDVSVFQRPELTARLAGMNGLERIIQGRAA